MKIFVYPELTPSAKALLSLHFSGAHSITFGKDLSYEDALDAFADADAILGNPPVEWFSRPLPVLRFWQLSSAGFNQYDALRLNAVVCNMGDFFARPCAETIVGGVLAFLRGMHQLARLQQLKIWKSKELRPGLKLLGNSRVLVLGAGNIGLLVKQQLLAFGAEVLLAARSNPAADIVAEKAVMEILPVTDVVINTLPGSADKYVSEAFIRAMKPGAVYANVGRGNTTDEKALLDALREGRLAGAVLDVTEEEPLSAENPLWEMENVILTQHTGGGQEQEEEGYVRFFIKNFSLFENGQEPEDRVQLQKGY
ncbi:MAG: D-2-hydroxyacid dehydrogenase [Chitinophagaceae bacterium]